MKIINSLLNLILIGIFYLPQFAQADVNYPPSVNIYSYQQPATSFNIIPAANVGFLILDPAGALLAGTVTMPASPSDGQTLRVSSSQAITTLTVTPNSGQSVSAPLTALAAGGCFGYIYRASNTTWYRIQ